VADAPPTLEQLIAAAAAGEKDPDLKAWLESLLADERAQEAA
jgi:hypothetical protein